MTEATLTVITGFAIVLALATVWAYERAMASLRVERDQLLDVLDDHVEAMRREARERHPSAQYGGGNLRIVR